MSDLETHTIRLLYAEHKYEDTLNTSGAIRASRESIVSTLYSASLSIGEVQILRPIPEDLRGTILSNIIIAKTGRRIGLIDEKTEQQIAVPPTAAYVIATRDGFGFVPENGWLPDKIKNLAGERVTEDDLRTICRGRSTILNKVSQLKSSIRTPSSGNDKTIPSSGHFLRRSFIGASAFLASYVAFGFRELNVDQVPGPQTAATEPSFDIVSFIKNSGSHNSDDSQKDIADLFRFIATVTTKSKREISKTEFAANPRHYMEKNNGLDVSALNLMLANPDALEILRTISGNVEARWKALPPAKRVINDAVLRGLLIPSITYALDDEGMKSGVTDLIASLVAPATTFYTDTQTGRDLYKIYQSRTQPGVAHSPSAPAGHPNIKKRPSTSRRWFLNLAPK